MVKKNKEEKKPELSNPWTKEKIDSLSSTIKKDVEISDLENELSKDDIEVSSLSALNKELDELKRLEIPDGVFNTESRLFISDVKKAWNKDHKLFKIFYRLDDKDYMREKNEVLLRLMHHGELIGEEVPELVLPESRVKFSKKGKGLIGFSMPYIENSINLSLYLRHPDLDLKSKIEFLKDIGKILEKVHNIYELDNKFFLGDVHEGNFLYDRVNDITMAVDLDSASIEGTKPFESRYLVSNHNLLLPKKNASNDNPGFRFEHKYPINEEYKVIPNKNTEYLCYMSIILNTITLGSVQRLSVEDFYLLLEELLDRNYPKALIDEFAKIYVTEIDNINVYPLLDELSNNNIEKIDYDDFQRRIKPSK